MIKDWFSDKLKKIITFSFILNKPIPIKQKNNQIIVNRTNLFIAFNISMVTSTDRAMVIA